MATSSPPPSRLALILAFAAIYLIWGSTYLAIRVAVETMPPFLMAGSRFAVAGILLFIVVQLRGAKWPTAEQWRDQFFIGLFLLLGGNALVGWAEQTVPSGLTTLILGASPLVMVLMEWLRPGGTKPTGGLWLGFFVGLTGLAFLLGPGSLPESTHLSAAAVLALLAATISWWVGSLYSKHAKSGAEPLQAAAMQMLSASVLTLLLGVWAGEISRTHLAHITPSSWWAFAYLVAAGSLIAFPTYVWLLRHSTPARVSTYAYVNPIVAVILGWAVLDEPLTWRIAAAAAVIISAVALITVQKTRRPSIASPLPNPQKVSSIR